MVQVKFAAKSTSTVILRSMILLGNLPAQIKRGTGGKCMYSGTKQLQTKQFMNYSESFRCEYVLTGVNERKCIAEKQYGAQHYLNK